MAGSVNDMRRVRAAGSITTAALFFAVASAIVAQLPTATILGTVKDSSGAVVAGVTLRVHNVETGQNRIGTSGTDGAYRFTALPVGSYEVRVEHPGFQSAVRSGLTLTIGQEAVVNFALEVGAIEQTVSVTAEAPLVNTTSGALGGLVDEQKVADLPLNGRNYVDLTLLQTGVQIDNRNPGSGGPQLAGAWFSSNGAPMRSNNFLLDGTQMDAFTGVSSASIVGTTLGVEGIREFRVVTNSFSAEYGMRMGSQMSIVSKGGTNEFHGSLYEYHRDNAMDARNTFDRKTLTNQRRLPAFTRNQFGASFGGPIKKNKTFFFAVYEDLRERLGQSFIRNVIPPSVKVDGGAGGVATINPVVKPWMALYPDPNLADGRFLFGYTQPTSDKYGQLRVDHTFSSSDSLFGRYTGDGAEVPLAGPFPTILGEIRQSRNQYYTISENHIFTPSLLNTERISYSRPIQLSDDSTEIFGSQYALTAGQPLGAIQISGVQTIGGGGESNSKQITSTLSDDLFYTKGAHSLKFGTLINKIQAYKSSANLTRGQIVFTDVPSFLLGIPTSFSGNLPQSHIDRTYQWSTYGFYAQDDWRVRPNLTLNLGLRYEFHTTFHEIRGFGSAVRDLVNDSAATLGIPFLNPSLKNFSPRFGFGWDVRGDGKTAIRGGYALLYDIGVFGGSLSGTVTTPPFSGTSTFNNTAGVPLTGLPVVIPPGALGKTLRIMDYHMQQPHLMQYNLTIERQLPYSMALTTAYAGSRGFNLVTVKEGNPTVPTIQSDGRKFWTGAEARINSNWQAAELRTAASNSWYNSLQVGLSKRLSHNLQFQSSYTWSKAIDETQSQLSGESSRNPVDPDNLKLDRASAGFDVRHNWKFNSIYRLPQPLSPEGVLAKVFNGWTVSGIVSMNSGYGITPVLGSNRSRTNDLVGTNFGTLDRPDLVTDRKNENIIHGSSTCPADILAARGLPADTKLGGPDLYFDPCAFRLQPNGYLGTSARSVLRGPGLASLDLSFAKDTAMRFLGEGGALQFRAEFFNFLNRPNYAAPGLSVFAGSGTSSVQTLPTPSSSAAVIGSTRTTARQVQLSLRLAF